MSPISPADSNLVPRREFIRDQRPASSFSILALSGAALLRLYSFPSDAILELRKRLDSEHLILSSRELIQNNFCELALEGKPWSNPKSTRSEKLLIEILDTIHRTGHTFLSTLDYGREQDDRIIMAFSRSRTSPSPPPPLSGAVPPPPFQSMSNDSSSMVPQPVKLLFAVSFLSQNHLRVVAPPLHLTPAILQTVRGSWPRGVVSEKKVADNVFEFKLKGYRWFQEDTFATDSLRHILSLLGSLDGFGFTLLTSLSLNSRSRSKDLWVFTGPSQAIPPESQSSSPLGTRTDLQVASSDKARGRRRSHPALTHSPTTENRPTHIRAATESSLVPSSHSPSPSGPVSSKSSIVRKPAPRAQLPVSVAQSTASNDNVHHEGILAAHSAPSEELRMELQSSVGSAVDMTGIGTQKYGRTGGPDMSSYQQIPPKFYDISPGVANSHYPSMSASVMKASQPGGSPHGVQAAGRTEMSPTTREATSSLPSRSRHSPVKATLQPGTPLLSPGAFRDSALSSNTGQIVDVPPTWSGVGRENGHSGNGVHSHTLKENVLPGGWIPASAESKESRTPGDYPDELNAHNHALRSPHCLKPEEQEVKVSVPEVVYPRHRRARSGEATFVAGAHRTETHRTKGADRLPPLTPRDNDIPKAPAEGWVLVSVGQPNMTSAPQTLKPASHAVLRRKQSFPPVASQKPPFVRSPYSTGSRGALTGSPVGSGHKKAPTNSNPSSMSPAAKAIVIIDAMQAKRKATSGDAPQSSFRKFFSLSRPASPKSPSKEGGLALSSGGGKGKVVEQEDNIKKRDGTRERWRVREVRKSDRRMSVD
ncbi:hypothetical protein BJV74DRAFT_881428 [Russula compacta]|nr:hypothetical protein BJV74DRAFT_881428 [Russula compacta]